MPFQVVELEIDELATKLPARWCLTPTTAARRHSPPLRASPPAITKSASMRAPTTGTPREALASA